MYLYQGFIELKIWGEGNGGRGGRGVGLSQLFQKFTDYSIPDFYIIFPIILAHLTYYSLIILVLVLYQNSTLINPQ